LREGYLYPPHNRGRFHRVLSLLLDLVAHPRGARTQYRTAVVLLSSSLPLYEEWRLCSCGCGALPPPVPRGGARFRLYLWLCKKKRPTSLERKPCADDEHSHNITSASDRRMDYYRVIVLYVNRIPQSYSITAKCVCQEVFRRNLTMFPSLLCADSYRHELLGTEPLQNENFV
jgi:hypothetical protein